MATGHRRRPPPRKGGYEQERQQQQKEQGSTTRSGPKAVAGKKDAAVRITRTAADSDSELSDAPDEEDGESVAESGLEADESDDDDDDDGDDDDDDNASQDLDASESEGEMAERLRAAGDGESLLGSAASDDSGGETDEEEERFIIEDTARRLAKRKEGRLSTASTERRESPAKATTAAKSTADGADGDPFPDAGSGSMSPETLHQLGLDELFDGADGALDSSSEPSFTDSFSSSESEDGTEDGIELEARPDDDQLTTDDEVSESDISDMESNLLGPSFLGDALAAGAGTQMMPGGGRAGTLTAEQTAAAAAQAEIPLLVIEDLDGRLIYARAGDGEAVFGSDGEFEFVDESDDESEDDFDDYNFRMDDLGYGAADGSRWSAGWRGGGRGEVDEETDEGETTDELPNEDMPFPRLLVGSVAPRGGRNARRARAMAARSRRISPSGRAAERSRESSTMKDAKDGLQSQDLRNINPLQDVDFSISTDDLARDPKATLEAAAKSLGLTVEEVAQLVIGSAQATPLAAPPGSSSLASPMQRDARALPPLTPDRRSMRPPPKMGSFMPTSSKSVHRAVIDGSRQAPSPFTGRHGTQRKGLAGKKRRTSHATPSSAKRMRQDSMMTDTASLHGGTAAMTETSENDNEGSSAHETALEFDEMDLDDVMDASLLWRGGSSTHSSSPPLQGADEKSVGKQSPALRAMTRRKSGGLANGASSSSPPKNTGLNMNAVARWHRIPMGAFRDGQVSAATATNHVHHPLGAFLLTRGRGGGGSGNAQSMNGNGRRHQSTSSAARLAEHSPFRGRMRGESIHLGQAPKTMTQDSFMVSPVLWPTRHGSGHSDANGGAIVNGQSNTNGAHDDVGQARTAVNGLTRANDEGAYDARKMMTRREKRERKARKALLKAALRARGGSLDDGDDDDMETLGSPAATLPHLSVTNASPSVSPLLSRGKPLTSPSSLSRVAQDGMSSEQYGYEQQQQQHVKPSPVIKAVPMDIRAPSKVVANGHGPNASSLSSLASPSSSLGASHHQPPSSVFGMPLHSPLFGSILNPPNLGFRDDLDDRDDEGILTI